MIVLNSKIERIIYAGNGFSTILITGIEKKLLPDGYKNSTTAIAAGNIINPVLNCECQLEGEWYEHPKYGMQFKTVSCIYKLDSSAAALSYLQSNFVKGVGPVTALNIVTKFKDKSLDIVENHYNQLTVIKGITAKKAKIIHDSFIESKAYIDLMAYFKGTVTENAVLKIYKKYGKDSIKKIEQDPYQLIYDIEGFGFKKADEIAKKSGISVNDDRRVKGAIAYTLNTQANNGHCFIKLDDMQGLINEQITDIKISDEKLTDLLIELNQNKRIHIEKDEIYLENYYWSEINVAKKLNSMMKEVSVKIDKSRIDNAIEDVEEQNGYELEPKQKLAISTSLSNNVSVITGGPGTGKTTIINAIVKAYGEDDVIMAAPTGRASRRMSETTGVFAQTLHRWLAFSIKNYNNQSLMSFNNRNCSNQSSIPFNNKLIIIDESSMLDIVLIEKFLKCVDKGCKIIFVGDIDQLPPIGAGNFFRDIVQSPIIPTVKLEFSHRVKGSVATNAHRVNNGQTVSSFTYTDNLFKYVPVAKDKVAENVLNEYIRYVNKYGIRNVQLLLPTRVRGSAAVNPLNALIRERLNPAQTTKNECNINLRKGDRVMYTVNDYDLNIFNGDCGIVEDIDSCDKVIVVSMDSGETVKIPIIMAPALVLAYATTIHKSQGSEYTAVVIGMSYEHYTMLQRNLLYTAMTRSKSELTLVGDTVAINKAISNLQPIIRNTKLKERLEKYH